MSEDTNSSKTPLEQTLKRCRPEVIKAAIEYQQNKEPKLLPTIVIGVLERYIEPERRPFLQAKDISELKLQADLGMDSLVMVEVVMTLEEVLGQQIPDTELKGLHTIGDTLAYVQAKATGATLPVPPERLMSEMIPMIIGEQPILVSDVILRPTRAEAVYTGSQTPAVDTLMNAAKQLAEIWGQRKSEKQSFSPMVESQTLEVDSSLPVQLRLEKENKGWKAFYLQTGKSANALGSL